MAEPLKIECPQCAAKMRIKDHSAIGKRIQCPRCQEHFVVQVPEAAAVADDWDKPSVAGGSASDDLDDDFLSGLESFSTQEAGATSRRALPRAPARVHASDPSPVKRLSKAEQKALREERERLRQPKSVMLSHWGVWGWIVGGTIGGAIGAVIWAVVTVSTGFEFGYLAWGLGVAVGLGVRIASGNDYGVPLGITVVILSILSIAFARFLMLLFLTQNLIVAILGIFVLAAQGFMTTPYDIIWFGLAGFSAYRASMSDDD